MAVISKLDFDGQDITRYNNQTISNINFNGVDYHFAKQNQVADGVCENAVNEPIVDMQIGGNIVQESENLFDKTKMITGFLPMSGVYPTTNSSYPNASYQIIDIEAGQTVEITYYSSTEDIYGRIRYIDNETNQVVGSVTRASNDYYNSTVSYNNGFKNGQITAKKDFKLGIMYLANLSTDFKLGVVSITPTPETPIEIQSVGDKTKNLFDNEWISGIYSTADGTYSASSNRICTKNFVKVKPNTNYVMSFTTSVNLKSVSRIIFYDSKGLFISSISNVETFITPENCSNVRFYLATNYTVETAPTGQIEEGTVATEYEPYGYRVPVKVSGENFYNFNNGNSVSSGVSVDENGWITINGDNTNGTSTIYKNFFTKDLPVLPSTEYDLLIEIKEVYGTGTLYFVNYTNVQGQFITTYSSAYTSLKNNQATVVRIQTKDNFDATGDYGLRTYAGYTKGQSGSITFRLSVFEVDKTPTMSNIYLNEPLRKIGDYADYIDYKNKKVIRKIYSKVCTGNETIVYGSRAISITSINPTAVADASSLLCKSNYYSSSDWQSLYAKGYTSTNIDTQGIAISGANIRIVDMINFPNADSDETQITAFKTWLAEQYDNNKPLIVDYILETPTEEAIEIPEISTFDGTNIFSADTKISPSEIIVDYWKQI